MAGDILTPLSALRGARFCSSQFNCTRGHRPANCVLLPCQSTAVRSNSSGGSLVLPFIVWGSIPYNESTNLRTEQERKWHQFQLCLVLIIKTEFLKACRQRRHESAPATVTQTFHWYQRKPWRRAAGSHSKGCAESWDTRQWGKNFRCGSSAKDLENGSFPSLV